jgi:hypothetical protein
VAAGTLMMGGGLLRLAARTAPPIADVSDGEAAFGTPAPRRASVGPTEAQPGPRSDAPPRPSDLSCPAAHSCVANPHLADSAFARSKGFRVRGGKLTCDPSVIACPPLGPARSARVVEVASDCGYWGDYYVTDATHVYLMTPMSVGCCDPYSPGWALGEVDGADPRSFTPMGGGLARDARHAYVRWDVLPWANAMSLRALYCSQAGIRYACDATQCVPDP